MEKSDKMLNAGCQCGLSGGGFFSFMEVVLEEVVSGSLEWDHQWDKLILK